MTEPTEPRLFLPAAAVVTLTATFVYPDGWQLRLAHRHEGDEAFTSELYDRLASAEAVDVVEAAVGAILGGACSCRP